MKAFTFFLLLHLISFAGAMITMMNGNFMVAVMLLVSTAYFFVEMAKSGDEAIYDLI